MSILEEMLEYCHNWFRVSSERGTFEVSNGTIEIDGLQDGQHFRVIGSVFNDGLHEYPDTEMKDETFDGEIWMLAIPQALVELSARIDEWSAKNEPSAYQSESFGGYSYSKPTLSSGAIAGWRQAFAGELSRWRKLP